MRLSDLVEGDREVCRLLVEEIALLKDGQATETTKYMTRERRRQHGVLMERAYGPAIFRTLGRRRINELGKRRIDELGRRRINELGRRRI